MSDENSDDGIDIEKITETIAALAPVMLEAIATFQYELVELSKNNASRRFKAKLEIAEKGVMYAELSLVLNALDPVSIGKQIGKDLGGKVSSGKKFVKKLGKGASSLGKSASNIDILLKNVNLRTNAKVAKIITSLSTKMAKNAAKNAAKAAVKGVKTAATGLKVAMLTNPVGWAFAALDGISMIVDLFDPCGLGDALFQQDLDEQIEGMKAMFTQALMFEFIKAGLPAVPPFVKETGTFFDENGDLVGEDKLLIEKYKKEYYEKEGFNPDIKDINIIDEALNIKKKIDDISREVLLQYKDQLDKHNTGLDILDNYLKVKTLDTPVEETDSPSEAYNEYMWYIIGVIGLLVVILLIWYVVSGD